MRVAGAGGPAAEGQRLPAATADWFGARFGHDFSAVRVLGDDRAASSAAALDAHAWTHGDTIRFARGAYAPGTAEGRRLIAHELAHVVQQRTGSPLDDAAAEAEARRAETRPGALHAGTGRRRPRVQRSPVRAIRTPETDDLVQHLVDERDPATLEQRLAEAKAGKRPVLTFPVRTTRFGAAPLTARRSGEDVHVKIPVHVFSNQDFRAQTRTLPVSAFVGGMTVPRWAVVKVVLYENPWYAPNITGSTDWDTKTEIYLPAEALLEISDVITKATLINIGATVIEGLSLSPTGMAVHSALSQAIGRAARNALAAAMISAAKAAPTALAGVASRATTTVVVNAATEAVERQVVSQATTQAVREEVTSQATQAVTRTVASTTTEAAQRASTAPLASAAASVAATETAGQAARQSIAGATEIQVSARAFEHIMSQTFPSQALHPVLSVVDGIGTRAAAAVVTDARFLAAVNSGNWALAGTLFHAAAAREARALAPGALPLGWSVAPEYTIQSGLGGSRADLLFSGPANVFLEVDWKTTGRSALSSGARSEMQRHAGQITAHLGPGLATQESRSWVDYVRSLLPGVRWPR
ncbi:MULTISPECIES: eCIS core domain-containing protein [unclassified Isoptericola]|uniref:eCIS core domain-containing protein n=1 Tax=unclassified Isoptericola TaxID=2623355 RepID=UPI0036674478